jgi:hypothetical protein
MPNPTYYALADLDWINLGGTGWRRASIALDKGEGAENPASTKTPIWGPCTITYDQAPDGGITAHLDYEGIG